MSRTCDILGHYFARMEGSGDIPAAFVVSFSSFKTLIKVVFPAPFSPNNPKIPFGISKFA